jgi:tRNA-Thr(GGU) m(6)t(6)A37 methyltransferase TsaA
MVTPGNRPFEGVLDMKIPRRTLFGSSLKAGSCGVLCSLLGRLSRADAGQAKTERSSFLIHPIGQVKREGESVHLRIFDQYRDALLGLDGYSHIFVLYWFDRNDVSEKRRILRVHPRGNQANPLTGIFACRAPVRPNLIGLTLCKVLSVADGIIQVDKIDALDGTPVVDIKPYIPAIDSATEDLRIPAWLRQADPV